MVMCVSGFCVLLVSFFLLLFQLFPLLLHSSLIFLFSWSFPVFFLLFIFLVAVKGGIFLCFGRRYYDRDFWLDFSRLFDVRRYCVFFCRFCLRVVFCSWKVVFVADRGFCGAFLVLFAHCFAWDSSVGFSLWLFSLFFPIFSVLVGISFLFSFPGRAVSISLLVRDDVYLFSWFVGLVSASVAVSAPISAVGVLVAS